VSVNGIELTAIAGNLDVLWILPGQRWLVPQLLAKSYKMVAPPSPLRQRRACGAMRIAGIRRSRNILPLIGGHSAQARKIGVSH
jgi:hypothetical protein